MWRERGKVGKDRVYLSLFKTALWFLAMSALNSGKKIYSGGK